MGDTMKKLKITMLAASIIVGGSVIGYGFSSPNLYAKADNEQKKQESVSAKDELKLGKKEIIQNKMYNSIDNFKNLKGRFIYGSDAIGDKFVVDYHIQREKDAFTHVKTSSSQGVSEQLYSAKTNEITRINHAEKLAVNAYVPKASEENTTNTNEQKNPHDKTYTNEVGEKVFDRREDTTQLDGVAATSIFPQDIAASFLEDYSKWDIVSENEKVNGLQAVLIEGTLSDYFQEKHSAKTFKLWVHAETGILLAMEEIDEKGEVKEFIETEDIQLSPSQSVNVQSVSIPSDYKKIGFGKR